MFVGLVNAAVGFVDDDGYCGIFCCICMFWKSDWLPVGWGGLLFDDIFIWEKSEPDGYGCWGYWNYYYC